MVAKTKDGKKRKEIYFHDSSVALQIQQLESQVMDAEKRAFTAQQQVGFSAAVCVCVFVPLACIVFAVVSGAVDGGEAGGFGQSVWRLGGAAVSAVSGAAGVGAGEGGGHRSAGSAAGRAGQSSEFHMDS